jgi:hypothetical protein
MNESVMCTVAPPAAVRIAVVGSIICPSPLSSSQSEEGKRAKGNDDGHERYFYFEDLSK